MEELSYTLNSPFSIDYWPFRSLILCPSAARPPKTLLCLCSVALCPGNPQILGLSFGKLLQGKSSYRLTCSFPGCLLYRSFQVSASVLPGSFNKSLMHLNRWMFCISYFVFVHFFSVGTLMYSKVPHNILKRKLAFFTFIF